SGYPISTYEVAAPQNYVTIRGFRVVSVGGQLLQYGRGGSHVVIEDNEFSAASSAVVGAGVGFGDAPGSTDVTIRNNVIHVTFGASGVIVKNLVYNVNSVGIYACDDAGKPVNTSITNNTITTCGAGLCLGNLDTASRFQVINNLITKCPGGGMGGWLPSTGT